MKSNYQLVLKLRQTQEQLKGADAPKYHLNFHGTCWQANKAFDALAYALQDSDFSELELFVCQKTGEKGYKLNGAKLGGQHGL